MNLLKKIHRNKFGGFRKSLYLCTRFQKSHAKIGCTSAKSKLSALGLHYHCTQNKVDPLAQSVEHNTFNVGVLGSSPKRITFKNRQMIDYQPFADFLISQMHHFCTT